MILRATPSRSISTSDLPTPNPAAAMNVLAIAAYDQLVDLADQVLEQAQLGRHLRAGDDRQQRRAGFSSALASASSSPSAAARRRHARRITPCVNLARCAVPKRP
jgi:hypothetical protein